MTTRKRTMDQREVESTDQRQSVDKGKANSKSTESARRPTINFLSPDFDARSCLYAPSDLVTLPVPNAKTFNNLAEYHRKAFGSQTKDAKGKVIDEKPATAEERFKQWSSLKANRPEFEEELRKRKRERPRKLFQNVLTKMNHTVNAMPPNIQSEDGNEGKVQNSHHLETLKGPLSVLYNGINKPIKILIRRRRRPMSFICSKSQEKVPSHQSNSPSGNFSWISGTLIAFDMHLNLVLYDTVETLKIEDPRDQSIIQYNIPKTKLFLRGDSIVLVTN